MTNIGSWLKRMIDAFLNAGPKDEEERKRAMAAILQQRERREKIHKRLNEIIACRRRDKGLCIGSSAAFDEQPYPREKKEKSACHNKKCFPDNGKFLFMSKFLNEYNCCINYLGRDKKYEKVMRIKAENKRNEITKFSFLPVRTKHP